MIYREGRCVSCGEVVAGASMRNQHQAFHDKARIEGGALHQIHTMDVLRAKDERTPLTAQDIAARNRG